MKLIKQLIKAKGLTLKQVAEEIGVGYHSAQKVIIRAPQANGKGIRDTRDIREKIAVWLNYPYELVWGPGAEFFLKKMLAEEIRCQAKHKIEHETSKELQALGLLDQKTA